MIPSHEAGEGLHSGHGETGTFPTSDDSKHTSFLPSLYYIKHTCNNFMKFDILNKLTNYYIKLILPCCSDTDL